MIEGYELYYCHFVLIGFLKHMWNLKFSLPFVCFMATRTWYIWQMSEYGGS